MKLQTYFSVPNIVILRNNLEINDSASDWETSEPYELKCEVNVGSSEAVISITTDGSVIDEGSMGSYYDSDTCSWKVWKNVTVTFANVDDYIISCEVIYRNKIFKKDYDINVKIKSEYIN